MIDKNRYAERRENLRRSLADKGLDALIVSHAANRYYLSGFELEDPQCNESSGWLVVLADGRQKLLTDPRYEDAAKRLLDEEDVFIYSGDRWEMIGGFLGGLGPSAYGFEPRALSVQEHEKLSVHLTLTPAEKLVEDLRLIKDGDEIELMRASADLNHRVLKSLPPLLTPGRTEAEVAWDIEKSFREGGAQGMAFDSIVGVGANAALPHAIPGQTTLKDGELVLVDTGGRRGDYCSDQTRTFWVGENPSDRFLTVRDQVRGAQKAAIAAIKPGMEIKDAYFVAQKYFEDLGVEKAFTHALGHGIGLETHEPPSVGSITKGVLRPGMVITVEPGLYYPDWGGIRWEHMVLITEDGCEVL